jgi:hypothetical protein
MKPGWKTSEFWLSLATGAWAMFGHVLPPTVQGLVVGVASGAYAIGRAITKAAHASAPAPR